MSGKKQKNRVKVNIKHFLSLLMCIAIMAAFCFFMNGRLGLYMALMMVIALIVSFFLTWWTIRQVEITFAAKSETVNKNDTVEVQFTVSKKTWVPTPFLEISLHSQGNLEPITPERFRISMGFSKAPHKYKAKYLAKYCTGSRVSLNMPLIIDYLGVFTTQVGELKMSGDGICRFGIIPMIHELNKHNDLLTICCDASAYDDIAEETDESTAIGNGVPGYEHREYVIGDPIKRINWKLSSKRDTMMIRLDEKLASASQGILFELSDERRDEPDFNLCCDIITEAHISMAELMLRQGLSCDVYCRQGDWRSYDIDDESKLSEYQTELADYYADTEMTALPLGEIEQGRHRVIMYFTNRRETLAARLEQLRAAGCEVYTVTAQQYAESCKTDNCYVVNEDMEFLSID